MVPNIGAEQDNEQHTRNRKPKSKVINSTGIDGDQGGHRDRKSRRRVRAAMAHNRRRCDRYHANRADRRRGAPGKHHVRSHDEKHDQLLRPF